MKNKINKSIVAIAAVCFTLPALAQKEGTNNDNPRATNYYTGTATDGSRDRDMLDMNGAQRLGTLVKVREIIGAEIKDSQDHRVAKVKDLAVDLQNGRIVEVIVATGGVLGMDETLVAVPPSQFTYDEANKTLQMRADKEQLKAAPAFKMSEWEQNVGQAKVVEVYQYYSAKPYFTADEQPVRNSTTATRTSHQLGEVERASKIMGTTVRNLQDEKVGKVENLMVNLSAGRVAEVILATGGFLGIGDELSAIPPQSFHYGIHPDMLTLDTTKETLNRAPHFKSTDWQTANNPDQVSTVYHVYSIEPYFSTNAVDNSAQNVRDRDSNSVTPFSQGKSKADVDTTREIRKQIMATEGLSVNARNVKIITVNGQVTLRGPVASDRERATIADIAAKVTSTANVDNELQVVDSSNPADNTSNLVK